MRVIHASVPFPHIKLSAVRHWHMQVMINGALIHLPNALPEPMLAYCHLKRHTYLSRLVLHNDVYICKETQIKQYAVAN